MAGFKHTAPEPTGHKAILADTNALPRTKFPGYGRSRYRRGGSGGHVSPKRHGTGNVGLKAHRALTIVV